ncbi:30S ribosomal protein S7 [candidate division WOR-1 bacterium RIFOXYB2_FULL_42_35]|uniref:Small ribosomal subunit protein uS7 n=1 Tax=candidate division WOR-1 bacterium RIFOXYC2_FULL_41_25 TaxID=1802586 RepID=A0A1F4TM99_UNCSA|nr:MAG: 30S ribosomal protein S7 [candidate division WOR-1 bacterium RIFOXYA2_FULL_41_14]OGC23852.1 MAG: 30S ribosomal protein S7 [candidate division WOR-1 bacterium RIFOXYB2_FULL_42_35]OGC33727.1 MAG: 30S ribosomal protein S7 [candidate division WOR-1 bacterium RIFOXYC2_FULL_41_25]OGC42926.1 MAG: 30S ribosomal protein S7 [candidate division WOR-1 bacterium RIFOXYD2_FULL_41_8]
MPRHGNVPRRPAIADAVYDSVLIHKFICKIMIDGKKSIAESIVYKALEAVKEKLNKSPMEVFEKALANVTPMLEVKARRVGGATYQVPVEVSRTRGQAKAMSWLKEVAQNRGGRSMIENLSAELIDAYNGVGGAIKKREDVHKTADANKAFAHFKW